MCSSFPAPPRTGNDVVCIVFLCHPELGGILCMRLFSCTPPEVGEILCVQLFPGSHRSGRDFVCAVVFL